MPITERESEILDRVRNGMNSPTTLAKDLGITQSGATQALQKLEQKGILVRTKIGRSVLYRLTEEESSPRRSRDLEEDLELIRESYNSLSKVWSHVLRLDLSQEELKKVREARNLLEEILIRRGKSLD
ncbi:MAG: winged helix DNA-binding protein [Methanobacteriota archaeon]|nr:MAG: winged helix DNA-binding protein [Euryarchaeota archaeon]